MIAAAFVGVLALGFVVGWVACAIHFNRTIRPHVKRIQDLGRRR